MMCDWVWLLLTLCSLLMIVQSLPTNLAEDTKKTEQTMRPKSKRAQEMLMFGNQQNHQPENNPSSSYSSTAEKRTLAASGLGGLKAALIEEEKPSRSNTPNNAFYDRKNYDYGAVNELGYEIPQVWDNSPYSRYYTNEDRRKRSEKSAVASGSSTTIKPSTTSFQSPTSTQQSFPSSGHPSFSSTFLLNGDERAGEGVALGRNATRLDDQACSFNTTWGSCLYQTHDHIQIPLF